MDNYNSAQLLPSIISMKSFPTRVTQWALHIKLLVKKKQTSIVLVNIIMNYYWKESWMKGNKGITAGDRVIKSGTVDTP